MKFYSNIYKYYKHDLIKYTNLVVVDIYLKNSTKII